MGILNKIKELLTGGSQSSSVKKIREANRTTNYGGGVSTTDTASFKRAYIKKKREEEEKTREVAKAFRATTPKAQKTVEEKAEKVKKSDVFNRANAFKASNKATAPTIKHKSTALGTLSEKEVKSYTAKRNAAEANRKEQSRTADRLKPLIDAKYGGTTAESKRRIKSGEYMSDPDVAKYEYLKHPVASSLARGGLSGATFGLSELAAAKLPKSKGMQEAERLYQANKSKGAEFAGEMAGSLASFGLTGGLSKEALAKVAPKTTARLGESATKLLSKNKLVVNAARNEAIRKIGISATEDEIAKFAAARAAKLVSALGEDAAINLTTGAVSDVAHAIIDSDNPSEFVKNMATSAGVNLALGGITSAVPAIRGRSNAVDNVAETLGRNIDGAGNVKVSLNRKRKTDLVLPNERPKTAINEDEIDDALIEAATTPEDFMEFFGLDRATAELLARDKARSAGREAVEREATFNPFDFDVASEVSGERIPKGNIKPLAETLRANKELPRSKNREWRAMPRSAKRVDTSIEGMTKQLDELKGRTWKTDRERRAIETKINDVEDRLNRAKWRREGGADMEAMQKAYKGEYAGFDMGKYTNSYQSDVLEGKIKGKTATIVEMSPDEYIERTYRQIFKKPTEKGEAFSRIPDTKADVEKYAEAMRNGEQFPLPYLDYSAAQQEGRHRALAAKKAGIDKIPVVIIDDEANPKAIIDEVAEATAKAEPPSVADDFPFATVDDSMPSTDPKLTAENDTRAELGKRAEQIAEQKPKEPDDSLKVNKISGDKPISDKTTAGVNQVRSAYEYNTGEKVEGGTLASWNEAWKASKEYSASHATGEKNRMSKVAVSQLNAMDSEAERELRQRLADSGDLNYDAIDTPELYDKIAKQMRDDPDRWIKDMIEINEGGALDFRSTPEWQARVQYIMGTVDPSADAASEIAYTEAFKLAQNISSKGGQTLNLRRNFVHLTPMGKRDAILDDLINILDKSRGFRKNHPKMNSLGKYDQREYIRKILMEDDAIKDGVQKLVETNDLDGVSEAFTELMLNVNKKNPKAGFDVLQELRYLNMLGNPKTHIRNVFGSAFFSPIRQTSNMLRSAMEKPISKWASKQAGTKLEVTRHGGLSPIAVKEAWAKNPTTEAGKAAQEAFGRLKADLLGSAKYETTMYKGRGKTAVGKAVDALSDFNSNLLQGEDDFFKSRAFKENYIKSYNRYLKDGKPITDKVRAKIEQEAMEEARIATFNEYSKFASWLNSITSKANDANASTLARWGGRGVNAVMPFTKVPANLMKQSMNYSPIGLAKGVAGIKDAAKRGDAQALNRAIDELASGMTGSAIFGLGMLLGKTTDMFTTNAGKNDPASKFKKDRGMQNYSITFKDPETGKGHSYTLDWLVPTSATFFSGVEMANQLKRGDIGLGFLTDWSTVMSRLAEPVMETSMLSGLHGMLETMRSGTGDDDTKGAIQVLLRETVQSYMNSLIPTLAGQVSRTAYKSDMQMTGDTDWEYWKNQAKSKAGLANTNLFGDALGADTDAYGNVKGEKKSTEDYIKAGLKNFLSPANIQKVDFSKVDNEKLAEYEQRVKDGEDPNDLAYLFPKKQYKKQFDIGDEKIKLSNKDLSAYNQAKTTGGEEGMRYILENIMFNRPTLDADGKKVPSDDAYTKEQKAKLMEQFKGKSMREVEEWLYEQPQFKSATDAERKKAINGLWTLSGQGKANASQRVGEQTVYERQGKDVNEYNFKNELSEKKRDNLQPLIDKGVVTYEEAVDFARNAGKTYYYENDEGGTAQTYFNKAQMLEYLEAKGYSHEKAEALFNAFKASNAKPYGAPSYRRGYGRRGYRRYGRRGRGGGKGKAVAHDSSAFKAKKNHVAVKKVATPKSSVSVKTTGKISTGSAAGRIPTVKSSAKVSPPKSIKRSASRVNTSPTMSVTPFNFKTVKPKSASKKDTKLAAALKDIEKTQKKVAPPKARSSK